MAASSHMPGDHKSCRKLIADIFLYGVLFYHFFYYVQA